MRFSDHVSGADAILFDDGVLFIKGTGDKVDIKQDLKSRLIRYKNTFGHRGSKQQADFLYEAVDWSRVNLIVGYSLGHSVALWLGILTQKEIIGYGGFRPFAFWQKLSNTPKATNYIYHTDIVPRIFWFRKYYGKVVRIKGKGFHPFSDHFRYQDLRKYLSYIKDEL